MRKNVISNISLENVTQNVMHQYKYCMCARLLQGYTRFEINFICIQIKNVQN